ncbi:MAG: hypothetical protein KKE51_08980 [Gammaproteobacteria bacterium]|nr:hypothetical protein [Gammaproteobacteria bacterium]MBU1602525.1 hypothetical protein [Gammaproteobacteria bacterium]MBU2433330.1 hypothetical protein [Gammaproteobacteria bacterium]MBU2451246.1 hypothetical protein [Gammaproteobacteria bacterium]
MAIQLPYGAAEIVALRTAGKRPADLLLISLVGPLYETNPVIIAQPSRCYDWRFVVALPVLIVATTDTPHLAGIVNAIDSAEPATLSVWFSDQQDGVNVLIDGYRHRTKTGRRMGVAQRVALAGLGSNDSVSGCLQQIAGQAKRRAMENADRFDAVLVEMATAGFRRLFGAAWGAAS